MSGKTIWKFAIPRDDDSVVVTMPLGSKILSAGTQGAEMFLWAIVDPKEPNEERRRFHVQGTGSTLRASARDRFIGTVVEKRGYVWHVFEQRSSR